MPAPSQPQELLLRADGEMGKDRVERAASTSVAASGPRDRAQHPLPRETITPHHLEDWHRLLGPTPAASQ